jgi:hypothetical protein
MTCGNCRWWDPYRPRFGNCKTPMPVAVEYVSMESVAEDDGTDCPCHEMKGSGDGE